MWRHLNCYAWKMFALLDVPVAPIVDGHTVEGEPLEVCNGHPRVRHCKHCLVLV